MFANKPNYLKLRTNLRLCINRLKLLEKKKTELALKARREIADYIAAGKEDRARIRVEHIIREDYLVEAMEITEMLCDLLLARFGLIEKMTELDPGLEESIATIIWVTPRLSSEVQELREVSQQLAIKYGKEYADMCRRNGFENVNEKVLHKMSLAAPPKMLVENYMIEIARTYKVPFEPDPAVMMGQPPETSDLIELGMDPFRMNPAGAGGDRSHLSPSLSKQSEAGSFGMPDTMPPPSSSNSSGGGKGGFGGGAGGGGSGSGGGGGFGTMNAHPSSNSDGAYEQIDLSTRTGPNPGAMGGGSNYPGGFDAGIYNGPPPGGSIGGAPGGGYNSGGGGGGFGVPTYRNPLAGGVPVLPAAASNSFPSAVRPDIYDNAGIYSDFAAAMPNSTPAGGTMGRGAPPPPSRPPNAPGASMPALPSYDAAIRAPGPAPSTQGNMYPSPPGARPAGPGPGPVAAPRNMGVSDIPNLPDIPGLPSVPTNSVSGGGNEDVDFDDLTRRFEELKKRK